MSSQTSIYQNENKNITVSVVQEGVLFAFLRNEQQTNPADISHQPILTVPYALTQQFQYPVHQKNCCIECELISFKFDKKR